MIGSMLGTHLSDSTYTPVWYESVGRHVCMDGGDRGMPSNRFDTPREASP